jgi:hypothetical protein
VIQTDQTKSRLAALTIGLSRTGKWGFLKKVDPIPLARRIYHEVQTNLNTL